MGTQHILFTSQLWWDNSPLKLISAPSRFSFTQPVKWPIFTWHQQSTIFSTNQYEKLMTVLLCDGLPCCHRKGAGFVSLKQDKRYVICIICKLLKYAFKTAYLPHMVPIIFVLAFSHYTHQFRLFTYVEIYHSSLQNACNSPKDKNPAFMFLSRSIMLWHQLMVFRY